MVRVATAGAWGCFFFRGDLNTQCSHSQNVNNDYRGKEKREKREAYMLGELRNKVRSVYTERFFPSAESSLAQSKLFSVEDSRKET